MNSHRGDVNSNRGNPDSDYGDLDSNRVNVNLEYGIRSFEWGDVDAVAAI